MSGDPTEPFLSDNDDEGQSHDGSNTRRRRYGERFAPPSVMVSDALFSGEEVREVGQRYQGSSPVTASKRQLHRQRRSKRKSSTVAPRARRLGWICLDSDGRRTYMNADKRALIGKLNLSIPIRDMRLLDHTLGSCDSIILVRENAIIASLEHVRVIIMCDRVILPRNEIEENPLTARFLDLLEEAIHEWLDHKARVADQLAQSSPERGNQVFQVDDSSSPEHHDETLSMSEDVQQEFQPLPFELIVLEAALKEVISSISLQASDIEGVIMPAMDAVVKAVNPSNLERVRKVKTRLQRTTVRCEAVRDELERFLQDDEDMDKMCLTRRKEIEEEAIRVTSQPDVGALNDVGDGLHPAMSRSLISSSLRRPFLARSSMSTHPSVAAQAQGGISTSLAQEEDAEADAEAHLEVENLLESYFMQVDAMYDKLVSVGEYIKDTEEYINIELDSSRNRLIRMDIILSVATFAIMPFNLVAGILGENLIIPEQITSSVSQFFGVNIFAAVCCLLTFYGIMLYMKLTKLI
ncbi:Magnesium transporter MRS2-3 [Picochlorum sp. SENEW3]|nr:Magnesium transporter MRS2-3 [Picochlorum sp. SENEW3]